MLSPNDKIFFGKEIFEDCEIFVEKFVDRDGQLCFTAFVSCKVSKLPERYQDIKKNSARKIRLENSVRKMIEMGNIYGYLYNFYVTFVSQVFTLLCMLSNSNCY